MTVNYLVKDLFLTSLSAPASRTRIGHRLHRPAARIQVDDRKISYWQRIFFQSAANGCVYNVDNLPQAHWRWPKNTWFQERLDHQLTDPRKIDH